MRNVYFLVVLMIVFSCKEKTKEHVFTIQEGNGLVIENPVFIDVNELQNYNFDLYNNEELIRFDYDSVANRIWFLHEKEKGNEYVLKEVSNNNIQSNSITVEKSNGNLILGKKNTPLVGYRYEMNYPPPGIDSIFRKSGYIHPIVTPYGDTLTRINPPDHWHHYGLWGPWTHTRIDTMRVDFWNLSEGQGTVLFKKFNTVFKGNLSSGFQAAQEHIDFKTQEHPQVALHENLNVKIWNLNREDRYMLDYTSQFTTPLKEGVLFEAYRYGGGLGMRFTERWNKDNCQVLTSEGNDRLTADGTNAKWAIVSGESSYGKGTNGILFMSYPDNRMHPEPMRVWPIDGNGGRGDMFFEFCPIRHQEWQIEHDTTYELKYRMVIFEGDLTKEDAEAYWQAFAYPTQFKSFKK